MNNEKYETMMDFVNKWNGSGIPIKIYTQKIGVSKSKFAYWVRKHKASMDAKRPYTEFIEVGSLSKNLELTGDAAAQLPTERTPQIVLTFPSGLSVKIYG